MKPRTPEQLAQSIEQLVTAFIAETRRTASAAIDRSLSSSPPPVRRSALASETRRIGKRRIGSELLQLCDCLYALVCAHPGESMSAFSDELGRSVRDLHRLMSKLKAEGRVRSVGERNGTRYFPAVSGRARSE